jgi:6-phosphofructokinase 1
MNEIRKIGILTSGGDAPGINACIRAMTRWARNSGKTLTGIREGYDGILEKKFERLVPEFADSHLAHGGTFLGSSRSANFYKKKFRTLALKNLKEAVIQGLIVIGGNGSLQGAKTFFSETGFPVIGIPKTIDNDVDGTDYTLGFDTALNNAVEALDKISVSATSHRRVFFVEVMGRDAGHIALYAGIASGAEVILVPETKTNLKTLEKKIKENIAGNRRPLLVLVAEGDDAGRANEIRLLMKKKIPAFNPGVSILGYIQRGGTPSCFDRILAAGFGVKAMNLLAKGKGGQMVNYRNGKIGSIPFSDALNKPHALNPELVELARTLGHMV